MLAGGASYLLVVVRRAYFLLGVARRSQFFAGCSRKSWSLTVGLFLYICDTEAGFPRRASDPREPRSHCSVFITQLWKLITIIYSIFYMDYRDQHWSVWKGTVQTHKSWKVRSPWKLSGSPCRNIARNLHTKHKILSHKDTPYESTSYFMRVHWEHTYTFVEHMQGWERESFCLLS